MRIWLNVSTHLNAKIMSYNYTSQSLHSNLRFVYTLHLYFWALDMVPMVIFRRYRLHFALQHLCDAIAFPANSATHNTTTFGFSFTTTVWSTSKTTSVKSSFVSSVSQKTINFDFLSTYFFTDLITLFRSSGLTAYYQFFSSRTGHSI